MLVCVCERERVFGVKGVIINSTCLEVVVIHETMTLSLRLLACTDAPALAEGPATTFVYARMS
jgi:hypothetical protein